MLALHTAVTADQRCMYRFVQNSGVIPTRGSAANSGLLHRRISRYRSNTTTTILTPYKKGAIQFSIYPVLQCFQMVQLGLRRFLLNFFGENLRVTAGNTMSENA